MSIPIYYGAAQSYSPAKVKFSPILSIDSDKPIVLLSLCMTDSSENETRSVQSELSTKFIQWYQDIFDQLPVEAGQPVDVEALSAKCSLPPEYLRHRLEQKKLIWVEDDGSCVRAPSGAAPEKLWKFFEPRIIASLGIPGQEIPIELLARKYGFSGQGIRERLLKHHKARLTRDGTLVVEGPPPTSPPPPERGGDDWQQHPRQNAPKDRHAPPDDPGRFD